MLFCGLVDGTMDMPPPIVKLELTPPATFKEQEVAVREVPLASLQHPRRGREEEPRAVRVREAVPAVRHLSTSERADFRHVGACEHEESPVALEVDAVWRQREEPADEA